MFINLNFEGDIDRQLRNQIMWIYQEFSIFFDAREPGAHNAPDYTSRDRKLARDLLSFLESHINIVNDSNLDFFTLILSQLKNKYPTLIN